MKKLAAFLLPGMLALGGSVYAQTNSDTITASITVDVPITQTTPDRTLSLPPTRRGVASSVDPVTGGDACAHVLYLLDVQEPVSLKVSMSDFHLVTSSGTPSSSWSSSPACTPAMSWSWADAQDVSIRCLSSVSCPATSSADNFLGSAVDGMGSLHVYLGATCTPPDFTKRGLYTSSVVVTCTYSN